MNPKQFTVIISDKRSTSSENVNEREEMVPVGENYLSSGKDNVLVKPPIASELREYDADVVVNETEKENLTHLPAGDNATTVDSLEDIEIGLVEKARKLNKEEHRCDTKEVEKAESGEQDIFRCSDCKISLGTPEEIENWHESRETA